MDFGKWDSSIHKEVEQLKRISTAMKIKESDIEINSEEQTAKINGSDGVYDVTLDSCTCKDFSIRQLPCKHIYRLASELNLVDELPTIDKVAAEEFKATIPDEIARFKTLYENGAISLEKLIKISNALSSK